MKGIVSEIGWTIFLFIAVMLVCLIAIAASIAIQFKHTFTGVQASSIEFVVINNKPYVIASSLAHFLAEDRQFIEHATEIMMTGSVEGASSGNLDIYLKDFFRYYKDKFIGISIKDQKENILFYVDNAPKRCGDDLSGFCVESKRRERSSDRGSYATVDVGCTDGRILIDSSKYTIDENKCASKNEACCVEGGIGTWPANTITCGKNGAGQVNPDDPGVCDFIGHGCSVGRTEIADIGDKCTSYLYSPGKSGTCCVPLRSDILVKTGLGAMADIPLVYKNATGVAEVTVI